MQKKSNLIIPIHENFGKNSLKQLRTCHPLLILLMNNVIKVQDCSIIKGHRNKADQNKAFRQGNSKLQWPDGNHNEFPSLALDAQPYPYEPDNLDLMWHFGGIVMATAKHLGIPIRWGRDWNSNQIYDDQVFNDFYHFELILKLINFSKLGP